MIPPTFSRIKSRHSYFPRMMALRACFSQSGQSESVCRGRPRVAGFFPTTSAAVCAATSEGMMDSNDIW